MFVKIPVLVYFGLCFLVMMIGALTGKKFQQKVGFPWIVRGLLFLGLGLDCYVFLFSLIFVEKLSFYNTAFSLINSGVAAVTGFVLLFSIGVFLVFFAVKSSRKCVEQRASFSLDTLPSRFKVIEEALEKNLCTEKEANRRIDSIHKMMSFFEKCVVSWKFLNRFSFIELGLLCISFIVKFFAVHIFESNGWGDAFVVASAVTFWNGIIVMVPVIMLCFALGVSFTDNNQRKILRKIGRIEKFDEKSVGQKDLQVSENEALKKRVFIQLGYGLIYLFQEESGKPLVEAVDDLKKAEFPDFIFHILDCRDLDLLEYKISFNDVEVGNIVGKHSSDEERIADILDKIRNL